MYSLKEEDLLFKQVRSGTDQWEVSIKVNNPQFPDLKELKIARVTERIIKKPRYAVNLINDEEEFEMEAETREEVIEWILAFITMKGM